MCLAKRRLCLAKTQFVCGEDRVVFGEDTSVYGEDISGSSQASASPIARALYQLRGPETYWGGVSVGCGPPLTNIIW